MSKECRELRGQNLALDSMGGKSEGNLARKTLQTPKIQIPGAQKSKTQFNSEQSEKEEGNGNIKVQFSLGHPQKGFGIFLG